MAIAGPVADRFGVQVWFIAAGVISILMAVTMRSIPAVLRLEDDASEREKQNGLVEQPV
jgi:hypothetical protein